MHLDLLGDLEALCRRDVLVSVADHVHDELGDVAPGNGDVLDLAANHIPLGLWPFESRIKFWLKKM